MPDNKIIDIHDPNEVHDWTKSLHCTKAIIAVGSSASAVNK